MPLKLVKHYPLTSNVLLLSFIGLFFGLGGGFVESIWAVYLKGFVSTNSEVGFITTFGSIVALLSLFFLVPLLEKKGEASLFKIFMLINSILLVFFYFINQFIFFLIPYIILIIVSNGWILSFHITLRNFSSKSKVGTVYGEYLTFNNLGWIIAPLLVSSIIVFFGFKEVFLIAAFLYFLSAVVFVFIPKQKNSSVRKIDVNIFKNLKDFFQHKGYAKGFIISFFYRFWLTLIWVYVPLFILDLGGTIELIVVTLGLFFVPYVLIEYFVGKIADKKGLKLFFISGFFIFALFSALIFVFYDLKLLPWLVILSGFGGAMIEPLLGPYFFKVSEKKESDHFYPIYFSAQELGRLFSRISIALLLLFLPIQFSFLFSAFILLIATVFSFSLEV